MFADFQINNINLMSTSVLIQSASEFEVEKTWKNAYIGLWGSNDLIVCNEILVWFLDFNSLFDNVPFILNCVKK